MDNLNRYVKHKKIKLIVVSISTLIPILIICLLEGFKDVFQTEAIKDLIVFRYFFFLVVEAWLILKIISYVRIIYIPDYAKKRYIHLTDERLAFVRMRGTNLGCKLLLYFLLIGLIVSGFYSKEIFYTLCCVLGASILTVFFATLYYTKKY